MPLCSSPELKLRKEQNPMTLCTTARKAARVIPEHNLWITHGVQGLEGSQRHTDEPALPTDHGLEFLLLNLLEKTTQNILKMFFSASGPANWSVHHSNWDEKRLTVDMPQDTVLKNKYSSFCHEEN